MSHDFTLPPRAAKPRTAGRTHLLDKGLGPRAVEDLLEVAGDVIDLVKLGWGTSLVVAGVERRVQLYQDAGVDVCLGGTLMEVAWKRGEIDAYRRWVEHLGISCVEVSDGSLDIPETEKLELIRDFARDYIVYSEVGSKDAETIVSPSRWVQAVHRELEAGAAGVILEGRESGTAGLYRASGELRMGLVDDLVHSGVSTDQLVFEAPGKTGQVWLLRNVGLDVNLANIRPDDAIAVETLRLGLRSDTLLDVVGSIDAPEGGATS